LLIGEVLCFYPHHQKNTNLAIAFMVTFIFMIVTKIEKGSFLTSGLSTVTTIASEINPSDSEARR